ncbi:MAG: hypothetical protein WCX95_02395 [Candidatus Gracilibacteria bacterium]
MKKFKLSLFFGLGVLMVMIFSGCDLGGVPVAVTPEGTMPQDLSVAIAFDHSNLEQVALFKEIIGRVPSLGLWEQIVKELDVAPAAFTYTANKELVESGWKIVLGMKFPSDPAKMEKLMTSSNFNLGSDGLEVYVAGKFAEPDKVQTLLNEIIKDEIQKTEINDSKYPIWRMKQGNGTIMIVRRDDVYFMASSVAQKDEILKRIDEGTGFDKSADYQKNLKLLGEKNLGYLYLDMKLVGGVYKNSLGLESEGIASMDVLDVMKGVWAVFSVENSGPKFVSKIFFSGDKAIIDKYYPDYKVSLVDKVPAKGVFLYEEMPSLGFYLEGVSGAVSNLVKASSLDISLNEGIVEDGLTLEGVDSEDVSIKTVSREKGYKSAPVSVKPVTSVVVEEPVVAEKSILTSDDLYGAVLEQAGLISGLTVDDLKKILDNPYAFVVSDVGGYIPAVVLYLQVDKDSVENVKKLVAGSSMYMDEVIVGLNTELKKNNLDGIVKKEVKIVDGATLQKVYIDWTALPAPKVKELSDQLGVDILTVKVEFYYGVLNDGVFVFALYPDFINDYGKEVVSSADYYKEMRASAGEVYGRSVVFFRTSPVLELVDRYFQLAKKMGMISEEYDQDEMLDYELYTKIVSAFDYVFVSDVKDSDGARSSVSLKIKEVTLSPELLKKREALEAEKKAADDAVVKMYQDATAGRDDMYQLE